MTPIQALSTVLDDEHAEGVIAHRKALKKPLTELAAKLLAKQFALCPDPNAAAEAMLINGWQGFKPEWMEPRSRTQQAQRGLASIEANFRQELINAGGLRQAESASNPAIQSLPLFTGRAH